MSKKFKITLGRLPDFKLPVSMTLQNGETGDMCFTVRHLKASELQEMMQQEKPVSDVEFIKTIASGWDLEEEFNDENIAELLSLFPMAAASMMEAYTSAMIGARAKN